mmetsp:Transcript_99303/g.289775  ORF Transcript_99303/g.289775 Transcript_99303/m.289775 type:complete len:338 (+) Transcript_99303:134-1147(+)
MPGLLASGASPEKTRLLRASLPSLKQAQEHGRRDPAVEVLCHVQRRAALGVAGFVASSRLHEDLQDLQVVPLGHKVQGAGPLEHGDLAQDVAVAAGAGAVPHAEEHGAPGRVRGRPGLVGVGAQLDERLDHVRVAVRVARGDAEEPALAPEAALRPDGGLVLHKGAHYVGLAGAQQGPHGSGGHAQERDVAIDLPVGEALQPVDHVVVVGHAAGRHEGVDANGVLVRVLGTRIQKGLHRPPAAVRHRREDGRVPLVHIGEMVEILAQGSVGISPGGREHLYGLGVIGHARAHQQCVARLFGAVLVFRLPAQSLLQSLQARRRLRMGFGLCQQRLLDV